MRLLELLRLIKDLPIGKILDLPDDWTDKDQAQEWLLVLCEAGGILAAKSETTADDTVVKFLTNAVTNTELFDTLHGWIVGILSHEGDLKVSLPPALAGEAEKVGIDPFTVIAIVEAIVSLIKLIRERRKG